MLTIAGPATGAVLPRPMAISPGPVRRHDRRRLPGRQVETRRLTDWRSGG
jgi:hypothetical protein